VTVPRRRNPEDDDPRGRKPDRTGVTRRGFIGTVGGGVAGLGLGVAASGAEIDAPPRQPGVAGRFGPGRFPLTLRINGRKREITVETRTTLLAALREGLDLTGAKEVCDRGACGACTVLLDGRPVNACLMLALDARGAEITTIEGLAPGEALDPVQQAFVDKDALMCGFCTPGMIRAAEGLLIRLPTPTEDQIRSGLSGNLCRCATYPNVFAAVRSASGRKEG
jgi:aerobic-type carbon monoxide dehydrogenase small subunit (CoxS/CutS family)